MGNRKRLNHSNIVCAYTLGILQIRNTPRFVAAEHKSLNSKSLSLVYLLGTERGA
jgi:hypothetical protein